MHGTHLGSHKETHGAPDGQQMHHGHVDDHEPFGLENDALAELIEVDGDDVSTFQPMITTRTIDPEE